MGVFFLIMVRSCPLLQFTLRHVVVFAVCLLHRCRMPRTAHMCNTMEA